MIRNSNCATKIAESQRTWKQNHLFLQKREPRNLRVLKLLAKSAESAKSASAKTPRKTRRKSASEKHKAETTSDETGSSEVVL